MELWQMDVRRALADDPVLAGTLLLGDKETISLPDDVWTDVDAFRSAAVSARRSADPTDYETALDLYLGDLLPDDRYEEWVGPTLDELRAELVSLLAEQAGLLDKDPGEAGRSCPGEPDP